MQTNGNISFSKNEVPTDYQWSGYTHSAEEFKENNFLVIENNKQDVFVCAEENGVALGDYLSNFILRQDCVFDIENVLSPGYDYWFFQAWEKAEPDYCELENWIKDIVELLIKKGLICRIEIDKECYFSFSDLAQFEKNPLPSELLKEVELICRENLRQHFEEQLDDYGDIEEISLGEGGKWAQQVFRDFVLSHPELSSKADE